MGVRESEQVIVISDVAATPGGGTMAGFDLV